MAAPDAVRALGADRRQRREAAGGRGSSQPGAAHRKVGTRRDIWPNPSQRPTMRLALAIRVAFGDYGEVVVDYDVFGVS